MLKIKLIVCAAVALIAAVVTTFLFSRDSISYCKSAIRTSGNTVLLSEQDIISSVILTDSSGNISDRITLVNANPFGLSYRSYHDLTADENGDIYVSCTVYGSNNSVFYEIYKLNFTLSIAERIWRSEENSLIDSFCAQSVEGRLFVTTDKDGETSAFEYRDGSLVQLETKCPNEFSYNKIIYINGSEYAYAEEIGVFKDGERLYPQSGTANVNGFNYDNGIVSFVDIGSRKTIHYDTAHSTFYETPCDLADFERMQGITAYSDGAILCSYESEGKLTGESMNSSQIVLYSELSGALSIKTFIKSLIVSLLLMGFVLLVYRVLFVRRKNKKKFRSIPSSATALSTVISLILVAIICPTVYATAIRMNDSWNSFLNGKDSQFLPGYISVFTLDDNNGSVLKLNAADCEQIDKVITDYHTSLAENGDKQCQFLLFVLYDDVPYCIYRTGRYEAVPAVYTVSSDGAYKIAQSLKDDIPSSFTDKRTTGTFKYTIFPFTMYYEHHEDYTLVPETVCICTEADFYRTMQNNVAAVAITTSVILGVTILLLIITNILLRVNMRKLNRLRNAFGRYKKSKDPGEFTVSGNDEVSATGDALTLMTESIRVHERDLSIGNRKYRCLMSDGVLRLLGTGEASKINLGDYITKNALLVRFVFNGDSEVFERAGKFAEEYGGGVLSFNSRKADLCFTDKDMFADILKALSRLDYPYRLLASYGELQAGSAGDVQNAWLVALSQELVEFDRLCYGDFDLPKITVFESCAEWLNEADYTPVGIDGAEYYGLKGGEQYADEKVQSDTDHHSDTSYSGSGSFVH